jgi:hypothetical protein
MSSKIDAFDFLLGYKGRLNEHILGKNLDELIALSNCIRQEDQIVAELLFPTLKEFVLTQKLLDESQLNDSMSIESNGKYRDRHAMDENCIHGSGARVIKHPFNKNMDDNTTEKVYKRWIENKRGEATSQQWVDYSIQIPSSFSILFEAKLTHPKSQRVAEKELVQTLYEASHYLGLPSYIDEGGKLCWKRFDYASMVICDASKDNLISKAFDALPKNVRDSFWLSAGIYPIILPISID